MTTYIIFIKSNKNPRTINTPMMGRTYYETVEVQGKEALKDKVLELVGQGKVINEICTNLGKRIYM